MRVPVAAAPAAPAPPFAWRWVTPALVALAVALLATAGRYGYHRDELYFRMLPPAWGYVDQPPLTPLLARTMAALHNSVLVLRLPAVLLAVASTVAVTLLARELGGAARAQGLAAWGFGFGTFTLTFGHLLLTSSVDLLVWEVVVLVTVRAVRRGPRWWWVAGAVAGLGTTNKWLVGVLVVSLLVGLVVSGPRRVLASPALLGAAALAVLLALPDVVWQLRHGLPQLAMGRALAAGNATAVRLTTVPFLVIMVGPLLFVVVVAGAVRLLRAPAWRAYRFLLVALVVAVALTVVGGAQVYYPYGLLAPVFAAGCVPVAAWAERGAGGARRAALAVLVALHVVTNVVIDLPVLPVAVLARTPVPALNQTVRDTFGWPTYVAQVDAVVDTALAADPGTVVLASNYGEAGALVRFGRHPDVPVVSGHAALWDAGGPPAGTRTVVVVGGQLPQVATLFAGCRTVTRLANGTGVDNEEEGEPVAVCTGPTASWADLWPRLRHLG
ncbi:glycosyltransferase family 39 protein [Microlunatus flavus]|uniref:glycosyltransferase family 39 protein n=1 Tax=Microlunatus flavus TaxID=1036181 RepID=UPI000B881A3A|nr:glycosyltransferase family 39 protein [Microlunatus flavus]